MSSGIRVNWTILGTGIALLLGFLLCMGWGFTQDPRRLDLDVMVGSDAPKFKLVSLKGQPVNLADLRGRPVVINFWSTWCVPCKQEHPVLQRAPQMYPDVTFLGVIYQDEVPKVERYLSRAPVNYQQLEDPDGKVAIGYGVTGVPETYFIDKNGVIVQKLARAINFDDLQTILTPLVNQ